MKTTQKTAKKRSYSQLAENPILTGVILVYIHYYIFLLGLMQWSTNKTYSE